MPRGDPEAGPQDHEKGGAAGDSSGETAIQSGTEASEASVSLEGKEIWLPSQVWASDISYIRLSGGYVFLVTIMDLYSRKILAWKVSNTPEAEFCVDALEEANARHGVPVIANTDQRCQYMSLAFPSVLMEHGIEISMDGVNRALDNIYVERFWRSLKYEDIYIRDYRTMAELKEGLIRYFRFYTSKRFHESLGYETPDSIYRSRFVDSAMEKAA